MTDHLVMHTKKNTHFKSSEMTTLSFFQFYRLLGQHRNLSERRNPIYSANKKAKWVMGFVYAFMILYILFFAIIFSLAANDSRENTSLEIFTAVMPFVMALDFFTRFVMRPSPTQFVKPYVLIPIPRRWCVDALLTHSLLSAQNLIWWVLVVPYCIMSVVFSFGILPALSLILLVWLLTLANSLWATLVDLLTTRNMLWWILPVTVYLLMFSPLIVLGFDRGLNVYTVMGTGMEYGNMLPHLVAILFIAGLYLGCRRLYLSLILTELSKEQSLKLVKVSKFSFFNRWGELGEYMKLETKLLLRNRTPKKLFLSAMGMVLMFSMLITFSSIYDDSFSTNFYCIYNFVLLGAFILSRVMSYEANYIDLLLVHRENIFQLLLSKYYIYVALLIIPFLLMLPQVIIGKWSLLMLVSYAIFTAGFQYFCILQLAVYNRVKLPLNDNFSGKGGDKNYLQTVTVLGIFFVPMVVIYLLQAVVSTETSWIIMLGIGIVFICLHKVWLKNIYNRMMKRKYKNLEAFNA